jgi:hypothetical protein
MQWIERSEVQVAIPEGYGAVPISPHELNSALRLCVIVRKTPDPATGHFVLLRDKLDAQVLLGCVLDRAARVQEWIEIWVQTQSTVEPFAGDVATIKNDAAHAERWNRLVRVMQQSSGELISAAWEKTPPPSMRIDVKAMTAAALTERPDPASPAVPGSAVFNPTGGALIVRRYAPVSLEGLLGTLTSGRSEMLYADAPALLRTSIPAEQVEQMWLSPGRAGRLLETLHLKLKTIADAIESTAAAVRAAQTPIFNLNPDSFRLTLAPAGEALPQFWTARVAMVEPGTAIALEIPGSTSRFFLPGKKPDSSIYSPAEASAVRGVANIRIRQILPTQNNLAVLEGTFSTSERLDPAPEDLVNFRLNLASGPMALFARLEAEKALAAGEWRFRTTARQFNAEQMAQLEAAKGVPFNQIAFEHLPQLSTPVDLHALGVLAVRALLVNLKMTLPVALDAVFSLARQVNTQTKDGTPLAERVAAVMTSEAKWLESLGPQHISDETTSAQETFDSIPRVIWWEVLAFVLQLFPGLGTYSLFQRLGDVPADGLHQTFAGATDEVRKLLDRTRSMLLIDWRVNREIHAVIRRFVTISTADEEKDARDTKPKPAAPPPASKPVAPPRSPFIVQEKR